MEGIKGRGPARAAGALGKIPAGLFASFRILREFDPAIVLGVGGYASGPAVLAARVMGTATAIAEQNAFPGLTNRILGRFADRIFLSFAASRTVVPGAPDAAHRESDPRGIPRRKDRRKEEATRVLRS